MKKRVKKLSTALSKELEKPERPKTRVLQATMSKTDLLLQCSWWVGKEVKTEHDGGGPEARFGSAFHEVIAWMLTKWDDDPKPLIQDVITNRGLTLQLVRSARKFNVDVGQLRERVTASFATLTAWLHDNEYGIDFTHGKFEIEQAYSLSRIVGEPGPYVISDRIDLPDEDHCYAVPAESFPGTLDLAIRLLAAKTVLIVDHKTGELPSVDASTQLESLSIALNGPDVERIIVAINHAPRGGGPCTVYAAEKNQGRIVDHAWKIDAAFDRVGDGSLRPGSQCSHCPALRICPTQTHALVALRSTAGITPANVGSVHMRLQQYRKTFAELDRLMTDEIKRVVKENGAQERPDGGTVRLEKRPRRELSMASIKRALGEVAGEREIQRLDAKGCVETRETEYLVGD